MPLNEHEDKETCGLWREDVRPAHKVSCDTCELAKQSPRLIWGEGITAASVWILLDNPGLREETSGVPFVCGTRQTLYSVLNGIGFSQTDLYLTFVVRRRPRKAYDKVIERNRCIFNFQAQLKESQPDFLMCLGDVAVQTICQNPKASVKELRCAPWEIGKTTVYATYHPLAVRRRPNLYKRFESDWRLLYDSWKSTKC